MKFNKSILILLQTTIPQSNDTGATSGLLVPASSPEHQDNGAVELATTGQGARKYFRKSAGI